MPKDQAEDCNAKTAERLLHARDFGHLRARRYGATIIVESGPGDDAYKHLRLTRDGVHVWFLHIPADPRGGSAERGRAGSKSWNLYRRRTPASPELGTE